MALSFQCQTMALRLVFESEQQRPDIGRKPGQDEPPSDQCDQNHDRLLPVCLSPSVACVLQVRAASVPGREPVTWAAGEQAKSPDEQGKRVCPGW